MSSRLYKKLKITITVLFLAGALNFGQGQTYFGITGGYGFAGVDFSEHFKQKYTDIVPNGGSKSVDRHLVFGGMIEQQLTEKYSLGLISLFSSSLETVRVQEVFGLYAHLDSYEFIQWQNIITFRYRIKGGLYFKGGMALNQLARIKSLNYASSLAGGNRPSKYSTSHPVFRNNLQYSAVLSAAYRYDRFMLELSYQKGLGFRSKEDYFLEPIDALSLSLYCLFKAPWGKRAAEPWF